MKATKTLKAKVAAILAVAVLGALGAGIAAPVASAHSGSGYYWSTGLAKKRLKQSDITWNDGSYDNIVAARCTGEGNWVWNDYGTRRLYDHFTCAVLTSTGVVYAVGVHVYDLHDFSVDFLGYL